MAEKLDLLLEAEKRGLLDDKNKALLDEARKRGLVPYDDPNVQYMDTADGEKIPVYRTKGKKLAGYIGGRPIPATSGTTKLPPKKYASGAPISAMQEAAQTIDPELKLEAFRRGRAMEQARAAIPKPTRPPGIAGIDPNPAADTEISDKDLEPYLEPRENYKILATKEIVRKGDDGLWYAEIPKTPSAAGKNLTATMTTPRNIAATALSAGAVMSGVGTLPMAGALFLSEALPEAAERFYQRNLKTGQKEKGSRVNAYVTRPVTHGVIGATVGTGSDLLARGGVYGANKGIRAWDQTGEVGALARYEKGMLTPEHKATVQARMDAADRFGVKLNTGQAVQSSEIASIQEHLSKKAGAPGDILKANVKEQEGQVLRAFTEGKGGLPKTVMPVQAADVGKKISNSARMIREEMTNTRRQSLLKEVTVKGKTEDKRLYKKAFKAAKGKTIPTEYTRGTLSDEIGKTTIPEHKEILQSFYDALVPPRPFKVAARTMKKNKKGELVPTGPTKKLTENPVPVTDLEQLDNIQGRLLSKAQEVEKTDGKLAEKLYNTRQNLLDEIGAAVDDAGKPLVPQYRVAQLAYKYRSASMEKVFGKKNETTLLNQLADLGRDQWHKAPGMLFGKGVSPQSVRFAKAQFLARDGGKKQWEDMTTSALTDIIEDIPMTLKIPSWKMDNLKAALPPGQYRALELMQDTMNVVDSIARPTKRISQGAGEGAAVYEDRAGGVGKKVIRATLSPFIQGKAMIRNRLKKHAARTAQELTGPGIENFLRLRQIGDKTERAIAVLTYLGLNTAEARVTGLKQR
jgi:hypothetical protein